MKLKRFVGADVSEAVAAVRLELGRDAVIVQTRRLRRPGWRGLLRRMDRVEVLAAVEEAAPAFGWGPGGVAGGVVGGVAGGVPGGAAGGVAGGIPAWGPRSGSGGAAAEDRSSGLARMPENERWPVAAGASQAYGRPGVPTMDWQAAGGLPPAIGMPAAGPAGLPAGRVAAAQVAAMTEALATARAMGMAETAPAPAGQGPAGAAFAEASAALRERAVAVPARAESAPLFGGPAGSVEPAPWQRVPAPARTGRPGAAGTAAPGAGWPTPSPEVAARRPLRDGQGRPSVGAAAAVAAPTATSGAISAATDTELDDLRRRVLSTPVQFGPPQPVVVQAGKQRVVVLVGPTGAGKTTTVAKLAAHFAYEQGWRVGVVTADTFRAGGAEQLACYARLLAVPCEVAPTPRALERALTRFADCEVVLVDTSGRGHRDVQRMGELARFIESARSCADSETHLVLPATLRHAEGRSIALRHRAAGAERLILTKLDECEARSDALGLAGVTELPLSYFAAGQRVPEDIAVAWPDRLAAWAEGGDELVERRVVAR